MPFGRHREHLRVLTMVDRLDDPPVLVGHGPSAVAALEPELRDGKARRPILRLHQQRAGDDRVGHLLVGVAVNDHVDPGHFVREARGDVLARRPRSDGIVRRRFVEPGVHDGDHDGGARVSRFANRASHVGNDVANLKLSGELIAVEHHRAGSGGADDPDS